MIRSNHAIRATRPRRPRRPHTASTPVTSRRAVAPPNGPSTKEDFDRFIGQSFSMSGADGQEMELILVSTSYLPSKGRPEGTEIRQQAFEVIYRARPFRMQKKMMGQDTCHCVHGQLGVFDQFVVLIDPKRMLYQAIYG